MWLSGKVGILFRSNAEFPFIIGQTDNPLPLTGSPNPTPGHLLVKGIGQGMPRGSSSSIHQLLLQRVHIGGWEGSAVQHIKKLGEALGRYTGEEGSEKICDMARRPLLG